MIVFTYFIQKYIWYMYLHLPIHFVIDAAHLLGWRLFFDILSRQWVEICWNRHYPHDLGSPKSSVLEGTSPKSSRKSRSLGCWSITVWPDMTSCRCRVWACFRSGLSSCSHSCEQSFHEESTNQNSFSDHCGLVLDIKPPQQTCSIIFIHNLRISELSVFKLKSILKILKQD